VARISFNKQQGIEMPKAFLAHCSCDGDGECACSTPDGEKFKVRLPGAIIAGKYRAETTDVDAIAADVLARLVAERA
jgi:hypothetical protein